MKIHPPTDSAIIKELLDKAHTVYYDDDPDCFVDIYDSPSLADANTDNKPQRVLVIVHGGYWRQNIDCHRRLDVAKWLIDRQETVVCVEYRLSLIHI